MHKKIVILATVTLLFLSMSLFSQERRDGRKKIKALKVSFLTEKLDLTEKEAVKFWPVYNKFEKIRIQLHYAERRKLKTQIDNLGGIESISEKEAESISKKMLGIERTAFQSLVDFHAKMSTIISYKKIVKLGMLEREFNRKLFTRYKKQEKRKKEH